MKNFLFLGVFFILNGCVTEQKNTNPNDYLTNEEQTKFKYSIVRYYDDLAPKATHETKFDTIFDSYYKKKSDASDLLFYYFDKEKETAYFAITKIAPSLQVKKVATVGSVTYKDGETIQTYEEKFRTWKMPVPELQKKTTMLFTKYIEGDDLSPYYTKNSNGDFIIEFPDEVTQYDTKSRKWVTTQSE
ncbi:hypothetical protein [Flavobacterium caseinilyticum]|uniref:Uncharacterized protein n=1 Tax=Flavobacterium caseinilyticum TaxID=2541732 RepID=A0A4R5AY83_9FLAO|nr:hypothetical protein [Flavobacterium caseinilyticum]TDD78468.1 hypothetical protein E0F89_02210 [Flavobacterium caseinilyticum]